MTDIDVRAAIALEELVPVVLTEAERRVALDVVYTETTVDLARITTGLPDIIDQGVAEKINLTLPRINELLVTASSTVATDLVAAETAVTEAKALTDSILGITSFPSASEVTVTEPIATTTPPVLLEAATTTDEVATSTEPEVTE
jgi:hypothetical protein